MKASLFSLLSFPSPLYSLDVFFLSVYPLTLVNQSAFFSCINNLMFLAPSLKLHNCIFLSLGSFYPFDMEDFTIYPI